MTMEPVLKSVPKQRKIAGKTRQIEKSEFLTGKQSNLQQSESKRKDSI
ncbi:hypothetical protein [Candidatus Tokpelaia sp.]|nr:hypothetical protein [Candidatus Tokpelaia sp.]